LKQAVPRGGESRSTFGASCDNASAPPFYNRNVGYNAGMIETVPAKTKLHRRFCDAVRAHRVELGLTQAVVAARLGVTAPTYNAIESGKASPTLDQVERVAKALGCDPSELLVEKVLT